MGIIDIGVTTNRFILLKIVNLESIFVHLTCFLKSQNGTEETSHAEIRHYELFCPIFEAIHIAEPLFNSLISLI